jgi:simple sugar transport system ATP-binding protein
MTCPDAIANADAPAPPSLVSLRGVTKRFGPVVANSNVDFDVGAGEVLALVGENGAGKSTIVYMLAGLLRPDEGAISIDGRKVDLTPPTSSIAAGIGVVHQHYMLVPTLSALDNIALQMSELGLGRLDRERLAERISEIANSLGFDFNLDDRIEELDVAHQQRIEIVKAMMHDVRLLILDEPTAVLGARDREKLFETIRRLKELGTAVILITHKLDDIFSVSDRVVVLRHGVVALSCRTGETDAAGIVNAMIGNAEARIVKSIVDGEDYSGPQRPAGAICCSAHNVTVLRSNGSVAVADLSLDLNAGEIVAVAGVDGNGQSEFVRCLAGLSRPTSGRIECLGAVSEGSDWNPANLRRLGVRHIPEDRRRSGIVGAMTLASNYLLGHLERADFIRHGFLRKERLHQATAQRMAEYHVRARGPNDAIRNLSGGNQQKIVLARELDGDPKLILAAHPSRGLDIKTIRFIHGVLDDARRQGKAVLFQSSDLDEILALADRIVVFAGGRAIGPVSCRGLGRKQIGAWIAGQEDLPS